MADLLARLTAALADRYRVEREIGRGGMAHVFLAHDLKLDRPVALKVLRPDLAAVLGGERFLREITLAAKLEHPHILGIYDSGEADGVLYYVMPYVEGESLRARLEREKQLPLDDALQIARGVADALSYAHSRGVIHRDIKPENILLEAGHAVVADFGIARAVDAAGGDRLTETGVTLGTPAYMSPEQAAGSRDLDGRSDLYSLACVLYEMLGGQPPFTGATIESVVAQHLSAPPPNVMTIRPSVPGWVAAALQRSLAKAPADRFNPVAQFGEAIAPRETRAAAKLPRFATVRRRASWVQISLMLLLVVAVGVIAVGRLTHARGDALTSLAVLPLTTLSGGSDWEYFADGMTEQLITELAQIEALTVISRTSAMQFKGSDRPSIPEIARDLHVDAVIEGSVLLAGERVRINVQLIQGATDQHLWAHSYEGELADVLTLQREVAQAIADRIQVTLTPRDRVRLSRAETVDPAAHEAYLRGRFMFEKRTPGALERSLAYFRQATETDPTYAAAHASLSITYVMAAAYSTLSPREALPLAEAAARQAISIDSSLAEGHLALAWALLSGHQWTSAEAEFRAALGLNPGLADGHHWYGWLLAGLGRADEAEWEFTRARELDPLSIIIAASWGWALFARGDHAAARTQLEACVELEPAFPRSHWWLGQVYLADGEIDRAITEFQSAATVSGGSSEYLASLAHAYAVAGRSLEARQIVADLERRSASQYVAAIDLALVAVGLGDTDRALDLLERAVAQDDFWLMALQVDPRFDPIRAAPRFQQIVQRMHFPREGG